MGLLAKNATKKRVAPSSGPVNGALTGSPWLTTAAIPAAALIRSSVFALNLVGVESSAARGRQSSLASLFVPTFSSKLWVETDDFKSWSFVLGMVRADGGIAADWVVELQINGDTATVGASRYLTKDDKLVHGEHHDALRNELLRALALGQLTELDAEAGVSVVSLKSPQPFEASAPGPLDLVFELVTSLDEAKARDRLALLGHRVLKVSPTSIRWSIGLPKNETTDYVELNFKPGLLAAVGHVGSPTPEGRRIAAHALSRFIDRALFLVRSEDEAATYEGPAEWKP